MFGMSLLVFALNISYKAQKWQNMVAHAPRDFFWGFRYGQDTSKTWSKHGLPKKLEKKIKSKPQISICNLLSLIPSALPPFKTAK